MITELMVLLFLNMAVISFAALCFSIRFIKKRQKSLAIWATVIAVSAGIQLIYVTRHLVIATQCQMNAPWAVVPPMPMRTVGCDKYSL